MLGNALKFGLLITVLNLVIGFTFVRGIDALGDLQDQQQQLQQLRAQALARLAH